MRRPLPDNSTDAGGQDSFLDVITNIVGILIILVMVAGIRSKSAPPAPAPPAEDTQLEVAQTTARAIEQGVLEIADQKAQIDAEVIMRSRERELLATQIAAAEQALATRRGAMNQEQQAAWDLRNRASAAQAELDRLNNERAALEATPGPLTYVESYPTPISRTVYGPEVHFQLTAGRLKYVPFDELMERAKDVVKNRRFTSADLPEVTFDVGPREGYRLSLTMAGRVVREANAVGFSLREAQFIPLHSVQGETLEQAFAERSEFQAMLAGQDRKQSTITIWFHPDSFAEFRQLKKYLHERGYMTAAWPLPEGGYITGSPDGNRSAAE